MAGWCRWSMNESDTATPPDRDSASEARWMFRTLACVLALTIAADILTYGFSAGLGWALFIVLLWGGILWNRDLGGIVFAGRIWFCWECSC